MAASLDDLLLHERVLLLALDDDRGTIQPAGYYGHAIAGGVLAELLLLERIGLEERRKKDPLVTVLRRTQTGDPVADDVIERIHDARRRATLETWIGRLAGTAKLKHRVAERLVWKGVLREREDRVLLLFRRRVYPELDPGPERALIASLREAILGDDPVDPRTAILATLAWRADLLRPVLDKKQVKARKERLEALGQGHEVAGATRCAIDAMQAAIIAATTATTILVTTSS